MPDVDQLFNDLNLYCNFENLIYQMSSNLDNAINYLEIAMNKLHTGCLIDDVSADSNKLKECYERLVAQRQFLNNACLNATKAKKDNYVRAIEEKGVEIVWS